MWVFLQTMAHYWGLPSSPRLGGRFDIISVAIWEWVEVYGIDWLGGWSFTTGQWLSAP